MTLQTSGDTSTSTLKFTPSSLQRPSGQFKASLVGPPSASVTLQKSDDTETWTDYTAFTLSTGGTYDYTDTAATVAFRLYRVKTTTIFSCNVVGYQDFTATGGVDKMIANPLNAVDNRVSAVLTGVPEGTFLYKLDEVNHVFLSNLYDLGAWSDPNMTLAPGEGVIFRTPSTVTKSFVGEVLQGYLITAVPSGLSIRASKFPKSDVIASLGFPIGNGDSITRMINRSYTDYNYHNGIWTPSQPTIGIGESFWINKRTDWKQNISVWP